MEQLLVFRGYRKQNVLTGMGLMRRKALPVQYTLIAVQVASFGACDTRHLITGFGCKGQLIFFNF